MTWPESFFYSTLLVTIAGFVFWIVVPILALAVLGALTSSKSKAPTIATKVDAMKARLEADVRAAGGKGPQQ